MTKKMSSFKKTEVPGDSAGSNVSRRRFLTYAGLSATVLSAASCKKVIEEIKDYTKDPADNGKNVVNLGSGDIGILNYAYALEQLEAAFYTQVVVSPSTGLSVAEMSLLKDIRDHEVAHREFFKAALSGNAIPSLDVDFSSINFA